MLLTNDDLVLKNGRLFWFLRHLTACACAVSTRSFSTTGVGAATENEDEDGGRYMLPLVDMLNHCMPSDAATSLRYDAETLTFSMIAERDVATGEVVEHSYVCQMKSALYIHTGD